MSISEDNDFDKNIERDKKSKRLKLTISTEDFSTIPLPPSPSHLPGCSPSYFTSNSPFPFTEKFEKMEDKILIENEKQVTI